MTSSVSIRDLTLKFGNVEVLKDLNLEVGVGEFLVLLGASGCGKSTLLNCIAGLLDISAGQIFIKEKNVTWAEPSQREIGMVFQSYALYPQMTVEGNLTFCLKNAGFSREEIKKRVAHTAEVLQIEPLLKRKPGALSGGQRQRVAIGRALVRDVDVFLFDEPLSNLDAKLRADLRVEIKRLHQKLQNTMIYVTHDQIEAMTLADRIAIMKDGVIQQLAPPNEVYSKPINKYVADFIGSPSMTFFDGVLYDNTFTTNDVAIPMGNYEYTQKSDDAVMSTLGVRPEHVFVGDAAKDAGFQMEVDIEIVEPMGSDTLAWTTIAGIPFRFRMDGDLEVNIGDRFLIGFEPSRASLFHHETEERI
ncbi:MAG: ABC transporter ATP-binding protein [Rhizobiales bacterium]|nr:ABC transporter ATP-binding protein [Hyphomicrobiales bacterium]